MSTSPCSLLVILAGETLLADHGAQRLYREALLPSSPLAAYHTAHALPLVPWASLHDAEARVGVPSMRSVALSLAAGLTEVAAATASSAAPSNLPLREVRTAITVTELQRDSSGGWNVVTRPAPVAVTPAADMVSSSGGSPTSPPSLGRFDHIVLALPPSQARSLLATAGDGAAPDLMDACDAVTMEPCLTGIYGFERPLPTQSVVVRGIEGSPLKWAASGRGRPGRNQEQGEAWVVHATASWSRAHLEEPPADSAETLLVHLLQALDLPVDGTLRPALVQGHRWRFSQVAAGGLERPFVHDAATSLAVCGDWCLGPNIEHAYTSGTALAEALAKEAK